MFFENLPLEMRYSIYRELVVSSEYLNGLSTMVGKERLMKKMSNTLEPMADVDATVLRTCRKTYSEALSILYGENFFAFSCVETMNAFKTDRSEQ